MGAGRVRDCRCRSRRRLSRHAVLVRGCYSRPLHCCRCIAAAGARCAVQARQPGSCTSYGRTAATPRPTMRTSCSRPSSSYATTHLGVQGHGRCQRERGHVCNVPGPSPCWSVAVCACVRRALAGWHRMCVMWHAATPSSAPGAPTASTGAQGPSLSSSWLCAALRQTSCRPTSASHSEAACCCYKGEE